MLWWFVQALNIFLTVVSVRMRDILERYHYCYHVVWLLPLVTLTVSLSGQTLGYGGDVWCSVHSGPSRVTYYRDPVVGSTTYDADDLAYLWNLMLIVIPVLLIVLTGVALILAVFVYMLVDSGRFGWRFALKQGRLWVFLLMYVYIYVFVFVFQVSLVTQKDQQFEQYRKYFECTFVQYIFKSTGLVSPYECTLDRVVSYPLWYIMVLNLSAEGIIVFLIFGTTRRVFWVRACCPSTYLPPALPPATAFPFRPFSPPVPLPTPPPTLPLPSPYPPPTPRPASFFFSPVTPPRIFPISRLAQHLAHACRRPAGLAHPSLEENYRRHPDERVDCHQRSAAAGRDQGQVPQDRGHDQFHIH